MRGYDVSRISTEKLKTINGGVLLFQPKIIGSLLKKIIFQTFLKIKRIMNLIED